MSICPFMSKANALVECTDDCELRFQEGCAFKILPTTITSADESSNGIHQSLYSISGSVSSLNNKKKCKFYIFQFFLHGCRRAGFFSLFPPFVIFFAKARKTLPFSAARKARALRVSSPISPH